MKTSKQQIEKPLPVWFIDTGPGSSSATIIWRSTRNVDIGWALELKSYNPEMKEIHVVTKQCSKMK